MTAPPPGMIPMTNPIRVPRRIAIRESTQSFTVGQTWPTFVVTISLFTADSSPAKISPNPNTPMARVTKSNPLCSSMTPKENRVLPEMGSSPTEASRRPSAIMMSPLTTEAPERVTAMRSPTKARENISGGPKLRANPAIFGANRVMPTIPIGARHERADGGDAERRPGSPLLRHLVPVDAGDHRRRFAREIQEDGCGGAAVLRTVEDPGHEDDGGDGRADGVGRGQEQGDRGGGPQPGEHPDGGAEQRADEREQDVHRGQGDGKAVDQSRKDLHGASLYPFRRTRCRSAGGP